MNKTSKLGIIRILGAHIVKMMETSNFSGKVNVICKVKLVICK